MIQVVGRIGEIVEILSSHNEGISLIDIESKTGYNKATLCNLLKSLQEIGFVEKAGTGIYRLGSRLRELAYPQFIADNLIAFSHEYARRLAVRTGESGLVAVRYGEEVQVISRYVLDRNLIVNSQVFSKLTFGTAAGHILLANEKNLNCRRIYSDYFSHIYESADVLSGVFEDIRNQGYYYYKIPDKRNEYAIASPVFRRERITAAIVAMVPGINITSESKPKLISIVKQVAREMSQELTESF